MDEIRVLTWSLDNTAKVWDANSSRLLLTLMHESFVYDAMWDKDESHILTWTENGKVRVWDAGTSKLLHVMSHDDYVIGQCGIRTKVVFCHGQLTAQHASGL
jgi:WD40 repeat protein